MKSHSLPITAALPGFNAIQLPIFWIKELRVILPTIVGCALCLLLSRSLPSEIQNSIINLFYPLTCSAVFALAFGHDYMHRTIASALAQPASRHQILRTRLVLCLIALLPLSLIQFFVSDFFMWFFFRSVAPIPWSHFFQSSLVRVFEPLLTAICLAPCLTILTRSVLFGTIVSMTAPFALGVLIRAVALRIGLEDGPRLVALHLTASFTLLITGAILTYRRFITQEAIETDLSVGRAPRARSQSQISNLKSQILFRRSSPVWQLIRKELMLQRLPAAIAALSVAIVFLVNKDHAAMLSIFYPATIIILIGAIASAEERRMGVIPSQVAHPISFGAQWLTKIAVAYTSALLFGVILPAAALLLKTDELKSLTFTSAGALTVNIALVCGGVLLILSIAIYISSLSESAIRAMLASLFVIIISAMLAGAAYNAYSQYLWRLYADDRILQIANADDLAFHTVQLDLHVRSFALTTLGFIPLALYFAMQNHRYLERSGRHLFRQAATLILYELAALVAISLTN